MENDDADAPSLSADTFSALQQFYAEQDARDAKRREIEAVAAAAAEEDPDAIDSIEAFEEDWQLSQFWYDDATAAALAAECERLTGKDGEKTIACVSCPTLFFALRKHCPRLSKRVKLFEYDKRFARLGSEAFVLYDYQSPLDVPRDLRETFDVVVADPPFLSEECLTKTAVTVKFLAKDKIILCTGNLNFCFKIKRIAFSFLCTMQFFFLNTKNTAFPL